MRRIGTTLLGVGAVLTDRPMATGVENVGAAGNTPVERKSREMPHPQTVAMHAMNDMTIAM